MMTDPLVVPSKRPEYVAEAVRVAPRVEVKLNWPDAAELGAGNTLTDACVEQGMDPSAVVSVHLPPDTTDRNGMSVAAANVSTLMTVEHDYAEIRFRIGADTACQSCGAAVDQRESHTTAFLRLETTLGA